MLDLERHRPPNREAGDRHDRECLSSRRLTDSAADSSPQDLAAIHRSWGFPSDHHLRWLLDEGVPVSALWPIGGASVRFDGRAFDLEHGGEQAITFRTLDRGEVVDLIAWNPQTGALASWLGAAFCLGDLEDIHNPATYFGGGGLLVHASPLEWLRAGREGIVIVRPEMASAYLEHCTRIACSDHEHALNVERWLRPPRATTEILIQTIGSEGENHGEQ